MRSKTKQPHYELAQVIEQFGDAYRSTGRVPAHHLRTLQAIEQCRTAALGGHLDYCSACEQLIRVSYNSCRNRHCPKCGGLERELWIQARQSELLPVTYYHVVFTIPSQLNDWCRYNPHFCYHLLFSAAWQTLRTFAADAQYLGASPGATMVLHTWGQNLSLHPHVHAIVPGGGLDQHQRWLSPQRQSGFLFPVQAMSVVFRAIYLKAFMNAWHKGKLILPPGQPTTNHGRIQWRRDRYRQAWLVYAKAPFGGPQAVIEYLGRYTHKVAISNQRIINIEDQRVLFRYKDYRQQGQQKVMALSAVEFLRRFCQHILPPGFRRMRHYGILSNRAKADALAAARKALQQSPIPSPGMTKKQRKVQLIEKMLGRSIHTCPRCGSLDSIEQRPLGLLPPSRAPPKPSAHPYT